MAVIIERGKEPRYVNKKDGVAAPAGGIAVGSSIEGEVIVGNNQVKETISEPVADITPEFEQAVEDLDNEIHRAEKAGKIKEWLSVDGNLARVEAINKKARSSYADLMERLGYKVEDVEINVVNTGTGAVATGGEVKAGQGGTVIPGNFKGNIVVGKNNRFK